MINNHGVQETKSCVELAGVRTGVSSGMGTGSKSNGSSGSLMTIVAPFERVKQGASFIAGRCHTQLYSLLLGVPAN